MEFSFTWAILKAIRTPRLCGIALSCWHWRIGKDRSLCIAPDRRRRSFQECGKYAATCSQIQFAASAIRRKGARIGESRSMGSTPNIKAICSTPFCFSVSQLFCAFEYETRIVTEPNDVRNDQVIKIDDRPQQKAVSKRGKKRCTAVIYTSANRKLMR